MISLVLCQNNTYNIMPLANSDNFLTLFSSLLIITSFSLPLFTLPSLSSELGGDRNSEEVAI